MLIVTFGTIYVDIEHIKHTLSLNVFNVNIILNIMRPSISRFPLSALLLVSACSAFASINVSYITLAPSSGYDSTRVYAGQVVASRAAELGFKLSGRVGEVMVDIGQTVQAGDRLASLDTAELAANVRSADANVALARANVDAARAEVRLAANTEQRFRSLREQGHTPKQTYDEALLSLQVKQSQLKVAHAQMLGAIAAHDAVKVTLAEATISAPFAGVIQARYMDEGSQINPGQPILRLVEQGQLEAHVGVPGVVGARLSPDNTYTVRWNSDAVNARLSSVLPEVDPATRTQTAVFHLDAANIPLGSTVELSLNETVDEDGYWLPLSALTQGDRGLWGVYVIDDDNIVRRQLVELVHTEANRVFARGTLTDGDRVVDAGVHRIVPGQAVTPTASNLASHAR